jgi:hypothetical protein
MNRPQLFRIALVINISAAFAAGSAGAAGGSAVECRFGGAVQRIEVLRDPSPERVCEMRQAASAQDPAPRVVWYAEHDRGFCHERADALIATLARQGWVCDVMAKRNVAPGAGPGAGNNARSGSALIVPRPQ